MLRPYADGPLRRAGQLIADLGVLAWVVAWVWVGRFVHDTVVATAAAGYSLRDGAHGVASNLVSAGAGVDQVPLVGGALATPLRAAGGAAQGVAGAGTRLGDDVARLATPLAAAVAVGPILAVGLVWGALRWRFARRAGAAATVLRSSGGDHLLALRALATQPLRELAALDADPVDAWRRNDPRVVAALADLELARCGVRRGRG